MLARLTRLAAAALAGLAVLPAHAEDKVVNVYNWSDYIAKDTLETFTRETGIKVKYDTYADNEILDTKLSAGKSGYDVVFPSASPFFAAQVKAGMYQPLDVARLPNAAGLDKGVMANLAKVDPGNRFGVPYMMAATGFAYNVDKIGKAMPDAPVDSWAMLFDPAVVSRFKGCGVSLLDTPTEAVPAMQIYRGKDPQVQNADSLAAAMEALTPLRPNYRYVNSERYRADLANGDICLAHGYVGDLVQSRSRAAEAKKKQDIAIVIPKEGALVNIDVMAIPADAPHPEAAHAFINFILRPDVIAGITNEVGYANAVPAAMDKTDPAIAKDPVIFPPAAVQAKLHTPPPPAGRDYDRARSRAWSKFRAAKK
ncbi:polyamine ABC transporter substrate-binding protein [Magnetospirillum sp. UT-4]|uniref:polyamine ABC transporter substrate-binding protein n=1 Tax=Magnetospirillum sp. UT-4 TaxID=2681467 RepID=UPI0013822830|nr:polyamine ABC transporter substrate-binding protein [Magnetospirillum sp. UT-4]CAA7616850.1 putrescine transporter subunit: periplasmic-binding component of ABC superfamily [Magnetospirillum sp. UT-4]